MDDNKSLPVGKLNSDFLAQLLQGLTPQQAFDESVLVGPEIGCDVAVVDTGGPELLLLKSDPITFATSDIGQYAVTVNANDIATAGGRPRWFLATALLPEQLTTPDLVCQIFEQLQTACTIQGIALVGGHTEVTLGLDRPIIAGTMIGQVERQKLVTPKGAQVGDTVLLTKGLAIEGVSLLARELRPRLLHAGVDDQYITHCANFLHKPGISVLPEAQIACTNARIHAMHDPTEGGVATGLWELAQAGNVGIKVNEAALPILPETQLLCDLLGLNPLGLIASGALLITLAPDQARAVICACETAGISCYNIATLTAPESGCWLVNETGEIPLPRFEQDELTRVF